jgi:long-chain acyl-CoA synthetase
MLAVILHHPKASQFDLSSMKEIVVGGAPLPAELAQAYMRRYPCRIREVYGLTEASGMGTANRRSEPFRPGSAGRSYINMEMRIVDDNDQPLGTNERGEICIRGPVVMRGYNNRPEDTAQTIRDGWLYTGDIGSVDEHGYTFIRDRKKEMIKYNGFGVAPAEIEALLLEHPGVADVAVIGKPDPEAGEVPKAFVVRRATAAALTADELLAFARGRLATYKTLHEIEFIDAIPKNPSGKLLRRVLVERERAKG